MTTHIDQADPITPTNELQPDSDAVSRQRAIALSACFQAEAMDFAPGGELESWLAVNRPGKQAGGVDEYE
jgi:hypothetical protein